MDVVDLNIIKNLPERTVRADCRSLDEEEWFNLKQHRKAEQEIDESFLLVEYLTSHQLAVEEVKDFSKILKKAKEWKRAKLTGDRGILI